MRIEPRKFSHDGRELEVRAVPAQDGWTVRVYENGRVVTGVTYSVSYETQIDASLQGLPVDLLDDLMNVAQTDIEQGRVRLV